MTKSKKYGIIYVVKERKVHKPMKSIINFFKMLLGYHYEKGVDEGLVDYSGEGRDRYGK